MPIQPRLNMKAPTYYQIALEHFNKINNLEMQLLVLDPEADHEDYHHLVYQQQKGGLIVIVFAAMALEAFINDYGISRLGNEFITKYERKSPQEKWKIVPRLVTGREIPSDARAMKMLNYIVKTRNSLVHSKSFNKSIFDIDEDTADKLNELDSATSVSSLYAIEAVDEVMKELDKIDASKPSSTLFLFK